MTCTVSPGVLKTGDYLISPSRRDYVRIGTNVQSLCEYILVSEIYIHVSYTASVISGDFMPEGSLLGVDELQLSCTHVLSL